MPMMNRLFVYMNRNNNRNRNRNRIKHNCSLAFPKPLHLSARAMGIQKKRRLKKLNGRIRKVKSDMVDIGEEQKVIKEGQRRVKQKMEAIESQYDQLRKETSQIMQQSAKTQIRLAFMFQILKARENQEYDKAAKLTCALREVIARDNLQRSVFKNKL